MDRIWAAVPAARRGPLILVAVFLLSIPLTYARVTPDEPPAPMATSVDPEQAEIQNYGPYSATISEGESAEHELDAAAASELTVWLNWTDEPDGLASENQPDRFRLEVLDGGEVVASDEAANEQGGEGRIKLTASLLADLTVVLRVTLVEAGDYEDPLLGSTVAMDDENDYALAATIVPKVIDPAVVEAVPAPDLTSQVSNSIEFVLFFMASLINLGLVVYTIWRLGFSGASFDLPLLLAIIAIFALNTFSTFAYGFGYYVSPSGVWWTWNLARTAQGYDAFIAFGTLIFALWYPRPLIENREKTALYSSVVAGVAVIFWLAILIVPALFTIIAGLVTLTYNASWLFVCIRCSLVLLGERDHDSGALGAAIVLVGFGLFPLIMAPYFIGFIPGLIELLMAIIYAMIVTVLLVTVGLLIRKQFKQREPDLLSMTTVGWIVLAITFWLAPFDIRLLIGNFGWALVRPICFFIGMVRFGLFAVDTVDEVFLISKSGLLIAHQRGLEPSSPDEKTRIVSGMMSGILQFTEHAFGESNEPGELQLLDHGSFKVLIEQGKSADLIAIAAGDPSSLVRGSIRRVVEKIDELFAQQLDDWDGDLSQIGGIEDLIQTLPFRAVS